MTNNKNTITYKYGGGLRNHHHLVLKSAEGQIIAKFRTESQAKKYALGLVETQPTRHWVIV